MKIGIVQPYFLPYIGYFALINAVDKFVYLDDVQYIRRGWVNRNRIKLGKEWKYITLPIKKAPLHTKINEVFIVNNKKVEAKFKKTLEHCYKKAPFYDTIIKLICKYNITEEKISDLNISLTIEICNYLDIKTEIFVSSEIPENNALRGESRIIEICKTLGGDHYINPIGGANIYSHNNFLNSNIKLNFLKINDITYYQGEYDFIPNLSIIDVLMWNLKEDIKKMLNEYKLV